MRYLLASFCLVFAPAPDVAAQPKPKSIISIPFYSVMDIDFSPDGKTIAVLTLDERARDERAARPGAGYKIVFCDVEKRLDWGSIDVDSPSVFFKFDSTGTLLFIRDNTLKKTQQVYVKTCKLRTTVHGGDVMFPISGDRRASIVAKAGGGGFNFFDVISGEKNSLKDSGSLIAVSPSGTAVATWEEVGREGKGEVRLHLLANGKWNEPVAMSVDHRIRFAHFLPGDTRLLVGSKVIDFTGKKIQDPKINYSNAIHHGRKLLAATVDGKGLHIVNTDNFEVLRELELSPESLAFSLDGKTLATGGLHPNPAIRRPAILLWDVDELLSKKSK